MTIKVILYGELKKKIDSNASDKKEIKIDNKEFDKIKDILSYLDIRKNEVSHIFLDHSYTNPEKKIKEKNKRLALFPQDMALLYKWYFSEN